MFKSCEFLFIEDEKIYTYRAGHVKGREASWESDWNPRSHLEYMPTHIPYFQYKNTRNTENSIG